MFSCNLTDGIWQCLNLFLIQCIKTRLYSFIKQICPKLNSSSFMKPNTNGQFWAPNFHENWNFGPLQFAKIVILNLCQCQKSTFAQFSSLNFQQNQIFCLYTLANMAIFAVLNSPKSTFAQFRSPAFQKD